MYTLVDRLLLLAGSFFLLDLAHQIRISLIVFLVALIISEFMYALNWKWFYHGMTVAYFIACLIEPTFLYFLPAILYESVMKKNWIYCFFGSVLYMLNLPNMNTYQRFYLFFLFSFMVVMAVKTMKEKKLDSKYHDLLDDARQMKMLMNSKNHEIEANQDAMIHVAMLQERNRIAREIHDNVGHMLSRSILMVGAATAINKDESLGDCLKELKSTLNQAMDTVRASVHDLHDDSIDLEDSVKKIVNEFSFCKIELDYDISQEIDRKVKLCFLAILKEACSNIIRHSNATKVEVIMREHPAIYQLLITDNGTVNKEGTQEGMGLSNMQERVQGLKGSINISKDHGYHIFVMIPKVNS